MLQLTIPAVELWDERTQEFISSKERTLQLEHSLVSIQKWESRWNKAFLSKKGMNYEETVDYIRCMTITQNVDPDVYNLLTTEHIDRVNEYIGNSMTATTFVEEKKGNRNGEVVTAEVIYYWMVALQIPSEYRKWHLNQLLSLIRVVNVKNAPPKKMKGRDIASQNAALNAARRKRLNSRG